MIKSRSEKETKGVRYGETTRVKCKSPGMDVGGRGQGQGGKGGITVK